jgi:hypothetical protein
MVYVVRAINEDGVTGTFTIQKDTLREAKESAKSLRALGLWVIIIGPDGETVDDETKEDPWNMPGGCLLKLTYAKGRAVTSIWLKRGNRTAPTGPSTHAVCRRDRTNSLFIILIACVTK